MLAVPAAVAVAFQARPGARRSCRTSPQALLAELCVAVAMVGTHELGAELEVPVT